MHAIKEMVQTPPGKYRERLYSSAKSFDSGARPKRATVLKRKTNQSSMELTREQEAEEEARVAAEDAQVLLETPSHHKGVFGEGGRGGDFEGLASEMAQAAAEEGGGAAAEDSD